MVEQAQPRAVGLPARDLRAGRLTILKVAGVDTLAVLALIWAKTPSPALHALLPHGLEAFAR